MKTIALLITLALASCATVDSPFVDASISFGTSRLITNSSAEKKPERIAKLHAVASGLDALAQGTVSRAAVEELLVQVAKGDQDLLVFLRSVVLPYFPAEDTPVHHNEKLSALARRLAVAIRNGLPPVPQK